MICVGNKQTKETHQREIVLKKTEWLRMELGWVPHEAGEQVLEWSWWGDPQVQLFI